METVYCVILSSTPPEDFASTVRSTYPDMYRLSESAFVVATDDPIRNVATQLGVRSDPDGDERPPNPGVVFSLNGSFTGWHDPRLWTWLRGHRAS